MQTLLRILSSVVATLGYVATFAQTEQRPNWLVETMYKSGKINNVLAVVTVLIAGLATWMFMMDRKLRKMEQQQRGSGSN
jgi:CcmD family protein